MAAYAGDEKPLSSIMAAAVSLSALMLHRVNRLRAVVVPASCRSLMSRRLGVDKGPSGQIMDMAILIAHFTYKYSSESG